MMFIRYRKKQFLNPVRICRIEVAGRFVGQNKRRIIYKRTGNRRPLPLPSRQLRRKVIKPCFQLDILQKRGSFFFHLFFRHTGDKRRQHHIFDSRKILQQVVKLKDKTEVKAAVVRQSAFIEPVQLVSACNNLSRISLFQAADNI